MSYALQSASLKGYQSTAELLWIQGDDFNFVGCLYETALRAAITGGHVQMVQGILQRGTAADIGTPLLWTPLQAASSHSF